MVYEGLTGSFLRPHPQQSNGAVLFLRELVDEIETTSLHHTRSSTRLRVYEVKRSTDVLFEYNKHDKPPFTTKLVDTFELHFAYPVLESLFIVQYNRNDAGIRVGLMRSRMHHKTQMPFSLHIPAVLNNIPRYLGPFLDLASNFEDWPVQASKFEDWPKRLHELLEEDRVERHLAVAMASHSRLKPLFMMDEALFCSGIYQQFIAPILDKDFDDT